MRGECKTFTHHALVAAYAAACPGIGGSAGRHGPARRRGDARARRILSLSLQEEEEGGQNTYTNSAPLCLVHPPRYTAHHLSRRPKFKVLSRDARARAGAAKDALSILVEHGLVGDEKAPTTSLQRTPAHNPHAQHKRTLRFKVDIEDLNAVLRNSAKTAALDH